MKKKLPFEEAFERQMDNLPLPSEDQAWQKMESLLDNNRDRSFPPVFFFSCLVWAVFTSLILTGIWFAFKPTLTNAATLDVSTSNISTSQQIASNKKLSNNSSNQTTTKHNNQTDTENNGSDANATDKTINTSSSFKDNDATNKDEQKAGRLTAIVNDNNKKGIASSSQNNNTVAHQTPALNAYTKSTGTIKRNHKPEASFATSNADATKKSKADIRVENASSNKKVNNKAATTNTEVAKTINNNTPESTSKTTPAKTDNKSRNTGIEKEPETNASLNLITSPGDTGTSPVIQQHKDFTAASLSDSATKNQNSAPANNEPVVNTHQSKKHGYYVSAGVAVKQEIPVAGQHNAAYNYKGTSNILSDYIPAVYMRLEKDGKWFVQGEFNYATPQPVKAFSYNRKTVSDIQSNEIIVTNLRVRKTYYNELPLSFNYYIKPNLSIGAGGMYSWFNGAVIEKETTIENSLNQTKTVSTQIAPVRGYTDSFFYKTQMHLLMQAEYNWKRFSFGFRYTKDLEPFVKYTLPDGIVDDKKNWSLDFILRFRLWRSRKFW